MGVLRPLKDPAAHQTLPSYAAAAAAAASGISGVTLAELEAELAADVEEEPAWELPPELREYR
jgi:hypothetical protein